MVALLAYGGSADSILQSDANGIAKWMLGLVAVAVPRSMIGYGTQHYHNACGKPQRSYGKHNVSQSIALIWCGFVHRDLMIDGLTWIYSIIDDGDY